MKNILISESEKQRILEMHQNATSRQYLNEATDSLGDMKIGGQYGSDYEAAFSGVFAAGETATAKAGYILNFSENSKAVVYSAVVSITSDGTALNFVAGQFTFPDGFPRSLSPLTSQEIQRGAKGRNNKNETVTYKMSKTPINISLNNVGRKLSFSKDTHIANITFTTNDVTKPTQVIKVWMRQGTQFGVAGASRN